jgi:hypothetical protein
MVIRLLGTGQLNLINHFIKDVIYSQTYINLDKLDSSNFSDKFIYRRSSDLSRQFGRRDLTCAVLVSHTGLAVALSFPMNQDQVIYNNIFIVCVAPRLCDGFVTPIEIAVLSKMEVSLFA